MSPDGQRSPKGRPKGAQGHSKGNHRALREPKGGADRLGAAGASKCKRRGGAAVGWAAPDLTVDPAGGRRNVFDEGGEISLKGLFNPHPRLGEPGVTSMAAYWGRRARALLEPGRCVDEHKFGGDPTNNDAGVGEQT